MLVGTLYPHRMKKVVVASTAVRAQQTARYSLEQTDVPLRRLETFTELEEMCQGDWENGLREATYTPVAATDNLPWGVGHWLRLW